MLRWVRRVNQLDKSLPPVRVTAKDLLDIRSLPLTVTAKGLRENIEVAMEYTVNWLSGNGAVGINNLMEDAATAEISRCQVWQWRRNRIVLDTGRKVTAVFITALLDRGDRDPCGHWAEVPGGKELLADSRNLLYDLCTTDRFTDFLTLPAYDLLP